ncbi:hypothetical protein [Mycolicibacterium goodii]|uniref:hypothetical protein n=1 Tax=Mycolicibacterium goodii TaxID=134601 RepID=UPI001BDC3E73|nr:hypothetical protein [Mycolicibacterium goodii]MBU8841189.1 hypothetical protein [Mycolicibacterium goodii]
MTQPPKNFHDVLAEAAWMCKDPAGDDDFIDAAGHRNAISDVTEARLRGISPELADRYADEYHPDAGGHLVWIKETPDRVEVVEYGTDNGLRSGTDLVNQAYDAAKASAVGAH